MRGSSGSRRALERPVAPIPVEDVLPEIRHVEVGEAVVVDIRHRDSVPPAGVADARGLGLVGEPETPFVPEEPVRQSGTGSPVVQRGAVDEVEVEVAVLVIVEEPGACPEGRDDEPLLRFSAHVPVVDAAVPGHFLEADLAAGGAEPGRPQQKDEDRERDGDSPPGARLPERHRFRPKRAAAARSSALSGQSESAASSTPSASSVRPLAASDSA